MSRDLNLIWVGVQRRSISHNSNNSCCFFMKKSLCIQIFGMLVDATSQPLIFYAKEFRIKSQLRWWYLKRLKIILLHVKEGQFIRIYLIAWLIYNISTSQRKTNHQTSIVLSRRLFIHSSMEIYLRGLTTGPGISCLLESNLDLLGQKHIILYLPKVRKWKCKPNPMIRLAFLKDLVRKMVIRIKFRHIVFIHFAISIIPLQSVCSD